MRRTWVIGAVCAAIGCGGTAFVAGDAGSDGSSGGSSGASSGSSGGSSGASSSSGGSSGSSGSSSGSSSGGSSSSSGSSSGGSSGSSSGSSGGSSGSSSGSSGSSSSSSSGGADGGRVPVNHRPNDDQCSTTPQKGSCNTGTDSGGPAGQCSSDTQCTTGTNGRCIYSTGGALFCMCTYDSCKHDTDCTGSAGTVCACHGSPYTNGAGNTCKPGDCRVDSDCGAGGYCSPSLGTSGCGTLQGYYCHTAADTCIDDSDCNGSGGGPQACTYSTTTKHWQCTLVPLCG